MCAAATTAWSNALLPAAPFTLLMAMTAAVSTAAGASAPLPALEPRVVMNETLREAAARIKPLVFVGSQFKGYAVQPGFDGRYRSTHAHQYSLSTVGNDCKWTATHPSARALNLTACVAAKRYADSVGQAFRGHNLCWGNDNPQWLLEGDFNAEQLRSILGEHVVGVMRGVAKETGGPPPLAWDVVNEACASSVANGSFFKPNFWYPKVPDYVDVAFRAAHEAAAGTGTQLFYNDFGAEQMGAEKSETVYAMVKSMIDRKVPIDGVGLQMHVKTKPNPKYPHEKVTPPDEAKVSANIARLGKLGLKVHITEMDVSCPDPCGPAELEQQAEIFASMLRACLANPGVCTSFESWGFTDAVTWLTGERCATKSCHPLPFDEQYTPKPAALAMLKVLQEHAAGL